MTANRHRRPRLLVVSHRVPYPPDKGDRIRTYHLLRQLNEIGDVFLATLADEPVTESTKHELNRICKRISIQPLGGLTRKIAMLGSAVRGRSLSEGAFANSSLRSTIAQWHCEQPFDVAICSASSVAPYLRRDGLERIPGFVDLMDCDSRKWLDFSESEAGPKRWLYRFEARRVQKLERDIARWAAAMAVVSEAEARILDEATGQHGTATAVPNGVDLDYFAPRDVDEDLACVFVGAMDYLPNVDAVTWFADAVWPRVRERHPTAEFRIVGRKPSESVQALSGRAGIVVTGTVPDVRAHLATAAVSVVPMRLSRGLQNKVLESLAMTKATIVAPLALAALSAVPGRDLLRAESADEWVTGICQLFNHISRRRELGMNGRRFVEANHDWALCLRPLTELILTSMDRPAQMEVVA